MAVATIHMKHKSISKPILMIIAISVFLAGTLALAPAVQAGSGADNMLWGGYQNDVQDRTGLGNEDPREMIASVIKILLGFLGIIAVLIILYGGFMWMTAAGSEDKVSKAKKIIAAGVIGLIIILMAFGLSEFVIDALYNATNATG